MMTRPCVSRLATWLGVALLLGLAPALATAEVTKRDAKKALKSGGECPAGPADEGTQRRCDDAGRLVAEVLHGADGAPVEVTTIQRDDDGLQTDRRTLSERGVETWTSTIEQGRIVEEEYRRHVDDREVDRRTTQWRFNYDGHPETITILDQWDGVAEQTQQEFDAEGRLIRSVTYLAHDPQPAASRALTYDDAGLLIAEIADQYPNMAGGVSCGVFEPPCPAPYEACGPSWGPLGYDGDCPPVEVKLVDCPDALDCPKDRTCRCWEPGETPVSAPDETAQAVIQGRFEGEAPRPSARTLVFLDERGRVIREEYDSFAVGTFSSSRTFHLDALDRIEVMEIRSAGSTRVTHSTFGYEGDTDVRLTVLVDEHGDGSIEQVMLWHGGCAPPYSECIDPQIIVDPQELQRRLREAGL